jgi:C4-type Zn-finger protein
VEPIGEVIKMTKNWGDFKKRKKGDELIKEIEGIKEGDITAILIIEDPTGNSAIIPERLVKEAI